MGRYPNFTDLSCWIRTPEDLTPQDVRENLEHVGVKEVFLFLLDPEDLSDMLRSEDLRIQKDKSAKFGYLSMMSVTTLGALNTESFCHGECVLSCVKLVVSDLHVCLKSKEIHMLVMIRMNRETTTSSWST
jgi:hypothetical protein